MSLKQRTFILFDVQRRGPMLNRLFISERTSVGARGGSRGAGRANRARPRLTLQPPGRKVATLLHHWRIITASQTLRFIPHETCRRSSNDNFTRAMRIASYECSIRLIRRTLHISHYGMVTMVIIQLSSH